MWFLLGFLALVLVEIVLLIKIGGAIGLWLMLGWIILTAVFGVILLKGIAMIGASALTTRVDEFRDPKNPVAHRALVLIAGLFLILPGPLTDTVGILLLIAPFRSLVIRLVARRLARMDAAAASGVVIDGEWRDLSASNRADRSDSGDRRP
jgi:UPF0716 protein FxsA